MALQCILSRSQNAMCAVWGTCTPAHVPHARTHARTHALTYACTHALLNEQRFPPRACYMLLGKTLNQCFASSAIFLPHQWICYQGSQLFLSGMQPLQATVSSRRVKKVGANRYFIGQQPSFSAPACGWLAPSVLCIETSPLRESNPRIHQLTSGPHLPSSSAFRHAVVDWI